MKIEIVGWQQGCNSVAAIKEIRARVCVPLNEALALVNRVLANEKVAVCVQGQADALQLVEELGKVGMTARIIEDSIVTLSANSALSQRP